MNDLLQQRKEIKRLEKEWERDVEERKENELREEVERRAKDVEEFEKGVLDSGRDGKRKRDHQTEDGQGQKRRTVGEREEKKVFDIYRVLITRRTDMALSRPSLQAHFGFPDPLQLRTASHMPSRSQRNFSLYALHQCPRTNIRIPSSLFSQYPSA